MTILERIERHARKTPSHIAFQGDGRTLTYGQLEESSRRLAQHIARSATGASRQPIAILGHKEPEMLIGFLGAIKAGHPYLPLDSAWPKARLEQIASFASPAVTLTPDTIARIAARPAADAPRTRLAPDDPFYLMPTSGTTGSPKGVVITEGNLESFVGWMLAEHHFAEGEEVFLDQAPFSFDLSVMDLYLALVSGGSLWSVSKGDLADPPRLHERLARSGITVWVSTPSFVRYCLMEESFRATMIPSLRRFLFCGEVLPPRIAGALLAKFPDAELWNMYGPTEATVAVTSVRITPETVRSYEALPIGYQKPESCIEVLNADGTPAAEGASGELVICGPQVSAGYRGGAGLTRDSFFKRKGRTCYRTGDWGRYENGLLFFEGRNDDQIKLHGYRIELEDIASNLRALPMVADAAVVPRSKDGAPDALAAFIILAKDYEGGAVSAEREVRAALSRKLPRYMVPRIFRFVERFPMNINGKTDRLQLALALSR